MPCSRAVPLGPVIIHDALRTGHAIDGGMDQGAELINKLVLQKSAVDPAAAFEKKRLDTKKRGDLFHRAEQIIARGSGEDIRRAVLTQFREVRVGYFLAQNGDDMVAADIVLAVTNAA